MDEVSRIGIGSNVVLKDLDNGRIHALKLVPDPEADPSYGLISLESALGEALLGRRNGDRLTVATSRGLRSLEIIGISRLPGYFAVREGGARRYRPV